MKKLPVVWFMLPLLLMLSVANTCWAVEEDEDGNLIQSKMHTLDGDEPPPKPKVIIREKVVMQCAPGTVWSPRARRCVSDGTGEEPTPPPRYRAPAPRQRAEAPQGDRYVYPSTKLRIKMGKCTMIGETVSCEMSLTNTNEVRTTIVLENTAIIDESNEKYKLDKWHWISGHLNLWPGPFIEYGRTAVIKMSFPLVNSAASSVNFIMLIKANNGSDLVKFGGIPLIK